MNLECILREISKDFEAEAQRIRYVQSLLDRFPNVTPQEYILLIPHLWVYDLWKQDWLCPCAYKDFIKAPTG